MNLLARSRNFIGRSLLAIGAAAMAFAGCPVLPTDAHAQTSGIYVPAGKQTKPAKPKKVQSKPAKPAKPAKPLKAVKLVPKPALPAPTAPMPVKPPVKPVQPPAQVPAPPRPAPGPPSGPPTSPPSVEPPPPPARQFPPPPPKVPPRVITFEYLTTAVNNAIKAADIVREETDYANAIAGPRKRPSELYSKVFYASRDMDKVVELYAWVAKLLPLYADQLALPDNGTMTGQEKELREVKLNIRGVADYWDQQAKAFKQSATQWDRAWPVLERSGARGTEPGGGGGGSPDPAQVAASAIIGIAVPIVATRITNPPKPRPASP